MENGIFTFSGCLWRVKTEKFSTTDQGYRPKKRVIGKNVLLALSPNHA